MNKDKELVVAAKRGSTQAVEALFDQHWPHVWRVALSITGRRDLADDVAQDAFVRAIAGLTSFDEARPFRPWVSRIALNRAIDVMRRERWTVPFEELPDQTASNSHPDEELGAALETLQPERRMIVLLRYWLGYPINDIAELLQIPVGTVASRLSRSLSDLRVHLEAERG